ncbi:hypothetical protein AB0L49_23855 [Streptomyces antimycoticus]|uniref:hypothetical protein n=1 Tax=Streptomyces antimycoticus TaxID=68175 RepID=UPI003445FAD4
MPDPITGEGFDAPLPDAAYAAAPGLHREMREVIALAAQYDARRSEPTASTHAAQRLYWLRRAALLDRLALDDGGDGHAHQAAAQSAQMLARFDAGHPEMVAGYYGPGSPQWFLSHRPYVRQEYAAWTAAGCPGT